MATDLEREIRELLSERAIEVRTPADAHPTMLRRARRRRVGTALVSSLVVVGFIAAGFVGTRVLLAPSAAPERETRLGGANEEAFAVWPQTTREEAREAQECVDAGREECMWQLNALEVVRRYAEQELGWRATYVLVRGFNEEFVRLPLIGEENDIGLVDVVDPLTIDMAECPPAKHGIDPCPVGRVEVTKPLRPDVTGIWLITRSSAQDGLDESPMEEGPTPVPPMPRALGEFLDAFMTARYRGEGAERFLSDDALALYESRSGGLSLYGYTAPGTPYEVLTWHETRKSFGLELRIQATSTLTRHEALRLKKTNEGTLVIVFARGLRS